MKDASNRVTTSLSSLCCNDRANYAAGYGGALFSSSGVDVIVRNCSFIKNQAETAGGTLSVKASR